MHDFPFDSRSNAKLSEFHILSRLTFRSHVLQVRLTNFPFPGALAAKTGGQSICSLLPCCTYWWTSTFKKCVYFSSYGPVKTTFIPSFWDALARCILSFGCRSTHLIVIKSFDLKQRSCTKVSHETRLEFPASERYWSDEEGGTSILLNEVLKII